MRAFKINAYPLLQGYNFDLIMYDLISHSLTRPHVSDNSMDSPERNYIETNPWFLTNSNALAVVLIESIYTKIITYRHS
jgi:hypothetical protein